MIKVEKVIKDNQTATFAKNKSKPKKEETVLEEKEEEVVIPEEMNNLSVEEDDEEITKVLNDTSVVKDIPKSLDAEDEEIAKAKNEITTNRKVILDLEDIEDNSLEEEEEDNELVNAIQDKFLNGEKGTPISIKQSKALILDEEDTMSINDMKKELNDSAKETESLKESKDKLAELLGYFTSGKLMNEIKLKSKAAGVSHKKVADNLFKKILGMIGDTLSTTLKVIGDTFSYLVNLLHQLLIRGGEILINITTKLVSILTLGYTAKG